MKTNVVMQVSALSKVNAGHSLREGSSVYVRVLKNNGNGSYIVSFANARFLIKSPLSLKEGSSFPAVIKLSDGKVILKKVDVVAADNNSVKNLTEAQQKVFLSNLNLIPDSISFSLFNQMKMLGGRFNEKLFSKARKISESFKEKEKQAAENAFILEEKGIPADLNSVNAIMLDYSDSREIYESDFSENAEKSVKEFFENLFNFPEGSGNKVGILTLFNHLGFNYNNAALNGNWIKIPFDFTSQLVHGHGSLCCFIKPGKKLDKFVLNFSVKEELYCFEICLKGTEIKKIRLGCTDDCKSQKVQKLIYEKFNLKPELLSEFSEFLPDETEYLVVRGDA